MPDSGTHPLHSARSLTIISAIQAHALTSLTTTWAMSHHIHVAEFTRTVSSCFHELSTQTSITAIGR